MGTCLAVLRWTARTIALLLFGLILLLLVGEGFNPLDLDATEAILSICLLIAWLGLVVLWRWEGLGGLMVVGGILGFCGAQLATSGRLPGGWVFPLLVVPGVLILLCRWKRPRSAGEWAARK